MDILLPSATEDRFSFSDFSFFFCVCVCVFFEGYKVGPYDPYKWGEITPMNGFING